MALNPLIPSFSSDPSLTNKPVTELISQNQEAGSSSKVSSHTTDQLIEYEQLMRGRPDAFFKQLTESDVTDRLVITKKMARFMPQANDSQIRVLDDLGDNYEFILAVRPGRSKKPTFKPKGWKPFINKRGAKPGDCIYFWAEVNEIKGTNCRIDLIPLIHDASFRPEGIGSSNVPHEDQAGPSDLTYLRAWATSDDGLTL